MRLVLDTNVIVSAFLRGGKPGSLLELAIAKRVELITSPPLMDELADVLSRRKFTRMLMQVGSSAPELLARYADIARSTQPRIIARTASDPDDDAVLGTASAAHANLIISGDRHLLTLGDFEGIAILNVADALLRIEAKP